MKLENFKDKYILMLIISMVFIIGAIFLSYNSDGKTAVITINATGNKSDNALADNVRIGELRLNGKDGNSQEYPLGAAVRYGNWKYDSENELLYCYNTTSSTDAKFYISDAQSVDIKFISEVGSGIANVYINGRLAESIDLYSNSQWNEVIRHYDVSYTAFYIITVITLLLYGAGILILGAGVIIPLLKKAKNTEFNGKRAAEITINAVLCGIVFVVLYNAIILSFEHNAFKKDGVISICATGEKNPNSVYTNIRIQNIMVNDEEYGIDTIAVYDNWKYSSADHIIYNYDVNAPTTIYIPVKDVIYFDIAFIKEVGSGIAEVKFNNKKVADYDLYANSSWDLGTLSYKLNPFFNPYGSHLINFLIFIFGILAAVICILQKRNKFLAFIRFAAVNIILSVILFFILIILQKIGIRESLCWIEGNVKNAVCTLCMVILFNFAVSMFTRKNSISFILSGLIICVMLVINYFKLQFRDSPFLPWDIYLAGEVNTVVGNFKLVLHQRMVLVIIITVIIAAGLVVWEFKRKLKKPSVWAGIISGTVSTGLLLYFVFTIIITSKADLFTVKDFYEEKGFLYAFVNTMQYLAPPSAPENYSEETMNEVYERMKSVVSSDNLQGEKPNVILIMSESFWDIRRVKELGINEDIFPTYDYLKDNAVTGEVLANIFGGGTVNSEFEAITGFSVTYLPDEYMPYQRCMRPDFFSINSFFKENGYDTLAMHPFEKTNYNRNVAYDYLNFDKTVWEEDFDEDCDRMRGYISDHSLIQKIIEEYEEHNSQSDAPWFNLSVSMQNHGGYWEWFIDEGMDIDIDMSAFDEESHGSIKDLAIGLHYADIALGELIDYFSNQDEPTVIIMFGDHMTDAGYVGDTLLSQSELLVNEDYNRSVYEQRKTPFMAWSNYKEINKEEGVIDIPRLLPTVFSDYDVIMPEYFEYLENIKDVYPACASGIFIDKDGNPKNISQMSEEQKKVYDDLWLIEYDYIYGKNYLGALFGSGEETS